MFFGENLKPFLKKAADQISSTMQRILIPKNKTLTQGSVIDCNSKIKLEIRHPLMGEIIKNKLSNKKYSLGSLNIKNFGDDWKKKFMYVWNQITHIFII
ncbi:MAG: hypothetical protein ACTSPD_18615 [Promethearchaeota archaeon]